MRAEHRSYRVHLALVPVAGLLILLALSYLWLHLSTPFDNGRLQPGTKSINAEGLRVMPLDTGPEGFQPGDVVTAVEGRSLESWTQVALTGSASPPRWRVGGTLRYTVIRNGAAREVAVTLGPYPIGEIVGRNWGTIAFALFYLPIAAYVFLRRPDEPSTRPLFLSGAALFCATTWSLGAQVGDFVHGAGLWLYHLSTSAGFMLVWIASFHFALVFPRPIGGLARRRWLLPTIYALPYLLLVSYLIASRTGAVNTLDWMSRWGIAADVNATVFLSLTLAAIVWQYRANRTGVTRRQIRWLVLAALFVGGSALLFYFLPPLAGGKAVDSNAIGLIGVMFPVAIAIAILRHSLFDIDTLLNRTLVYGSLTAVVISLYVLVVGVLGTILQTSGNLFVALVATGLAAIVFQPLRERLQRGVNRMMYGERDEPFEVLSRLGRRLEANLSPDTTLKSIVETVAQALKLPYVAIALKDVGGNVKDAAPSELPHPSSLILHSVTLVASYGLPVANTLRLPLVYQSETIGQLILAPRARGESFTPAEQRLLESIAYQAGVAAHNVRLTADLQRSRERLVTAREEERRRLRRDLHDGLGPALASLTLKLDAARNQLRRDPDAADHLLGELKAQTQTAIADIRRVAYDLRPPALDELGLVSAIREQVARYSTNGLTVTAEAPQVLPPLPAAVEVAAYRIVLEALTKVVRHAGARHCAVRFSVEDALTLEIVDDGRGLPADARAGVGLTSMRERAAELGGTCIVERVSTGGTRVMARLPFKG